MLAFRKKIGSAGDRIAGLLGMVDIIQADGDEFRDAGHRRAEPRLAADSRKLGGVEGGELGQRGRRIGLAIEVLHMRRRDRAIGPICRSGRAFPGQLPRNEQASFLFTPWDGWLLGCFLEQRAAKFNC